MAFLSRPFQAPTDLQAMTAVLIRLRVADLVDAWPSIAHLRVICSTPDAGWTIHVWTDEAQDLIAFALLDTTYGSLYLYYLPEHETDDLNLQIITWAQQQRQAANPDHPTLRCIVLDRDSTRIASVERLGFEQDERSTLRMVRPLDEPIAEPKLPDGFVIRAVAGEQEVEAYVALHRDAFGTEVMTIEHRLAIMRDPAYRPDLDLVVVAPDGTLAAFCCCSIVVEENKALGRRAGWTDPIGTRPAFRRRGLATAVILDGLRRLKASGIDTAMLGTGSWNTVAQQTFQSAGFREAYRILRYRWVQPDVLR